MKELEIYPNKGKLTRLFLWPIIGIPVLYFFVVIPDEDIGMQSGGGFFTSLTVIMSIFLLGAIVMYIRQYSSSQKKPVLRISEKEIHFVRGGKKMPLSEEYGYTSKNFNSNSTIYIWKNKKKRAHVDATYLDLNTEYVTAFLNELTNSPESQRGDLLETFHTALVGQNDPDITERLVFRKDGQTVLEESKAVE